MSSFWIKTHPVIKLLFRNYIWDIPNTDKTVYLTFDDGPIPEITEWALAQLERYNAKATFFCIGDNIRKNPQIFNRVVASGHAIGNHTFHHLEGWKTPTDAYLENVQQCEEMIALTGNPKSRLFRPPYGKIKPSQSRKLRKMGYKIIMWDIISYDFDRNLTPEKCVENVLKNVRPGSIIVFHDSQKAFRNLEYALPKTLEFLRQNGYSSAAIG